MRLDHDLQECCLTAQVSELEMTSRNSCCVMHCLRRTCCSDTNQHAARHPASVCIGNTRIQKPPLRKRDARRHTSTAKATLRQERPAWTVLVGTGYGCAGNAATARNWCRLGACVPHGDCCNRAAAEEQSSRTELKWMTAERCLLQMCLERDMEM